jgi:hypothetical protein
VVGQRQGRHALLGHPLRHLTDTAQPVEQAELGVDVEVAEGVAGARLGSLGHLWMVARLIRPAWAQSREIPRCVNGAEKQWASRRSDTRRAALPRVAVAGYGSVSATVPLTVALYVMQRPNRDLR